MPEVRGVLAALDQQGTELFGWARQSALPFPHVFLGDSAAIAPPSDALSREADERGVGAKLVRDEGVNREATLVGERLWIDHQVIVGQGRPLREQGFLSGIASTPYRRTRTSRPSRRG